MGFWDFLRRPGPIAHMTPNVSYLGADELQSIVVGDLTPSQMWSTQPHLRTVVSFLARNVAQLGLHSFQRDGEDRKRDRTSPFAATMRRPNADQTAFDMIFALVGDWSLYDRAYWLTVPDQDAPSGWTFRRLPPPWVTPIARDVFGAKAYRVTSPNGKSVDVSADDVLAFTGYHPTNPRCGSPTVEALKETLQEQIEASRYRGQVWKRGGRVSAVIERPKDAPVWSDNAKEQFREDWYAKFTGRGERAGGTPILEDGMKLTRVDFNAQEQQFVEAAKLSFATVASAFHVNPTMVGILDNANYSNVREFRRMLYGDTLGPIIAQIEDRVNTFLLPRLGMDNAEFYSEFNIAEKLQGSFEEQAAVMQTLVGAPLMTRNEGRSKFNLPAITGGDDLVTPLNVLIGGQASPTDSGSQNETGKTALSALKSGPRRALKAPPSDSQREQARGVLIKFFGRQKAAVLSKLSAGSDWWDGKRWDRELAADLLPFSRDLAATLGKAEAERLGYTEGDYDPDLTVEFLTAVAERHAASVNETTKQALDDTLAADGDPAEVFTAAESRADGIGSLIVTFAAGFAVVEAAKQIGRANNVEPTKTWVTGDNPRPEHASMDGETVAIDEQFSNGEDWPGGLPGCNCSVSTSIP